MQTLTIHRLVLSAVLLLIALPLIAAANNVPASSSQQQSQSSQQPQETQEPTDRPRRRRSLSLFANLMYDLNLTDRQKMYFGVFTMFLLSLPHLLGWKGAKSKYGHVMERQRRRQREREKKKDKQK